MSDVRWLKLPADFPAPNIVVASPSLEWKSSDERERYAILSPLTSTQELELCVAAMAFFSPTSYRRFRAEVSPQEPTATNPLRVDEFVAYLDKAGNPEIPRRSQQVLDLFTRLEAAGVLLRKRLWGESTAPLIRGYEYVRELTTIEQQSCLWLGPVLGPEFIATATAGAVAHITGTTPSGDQYGGTGVLTTPRLVVTCAHVITDMRLDQTLRIIDKDYGIAAAVSHSKADIGIIELDADVEVVPGLAWGMQRLLEPGVALGYAPVPLARHAVLASHRTEINGAFVGTDGEEYILLSSIARPGDSGGPIVSMSGRLLGIITRSLEHQREETDRGTGPLPFFAAVPANRVIEVVRELRPDVSLPVEDYL